MTMSEAAAATTEASPTVVRGPRYTVVVAVGDRLRARSDRLAALQPLLDRNVELLIVCAGGASELPWSFVNRRGIRVINAPDDSTAADLRAIGMHSAVGDIVVLLSEQDVLESAWTRHVRALHPAPESAPMLKAN